MPKIQNVQHKIQQGQKFGNKKVCVITGTSSGLGKQAAKALLQTGQWHVIGAVRDLDKMEQVAEEEGFDKKDFTMIHCDLASFASVRKFVDDLKEFKVGKPLDRLVCNAAVYQPTLDYAKYTEDDIEQQIQINHLSHFLMISLLIDDMREAVQPRVILVGSVTGNDNTVGGGGVYPIADLRELDGLKAGAKRPIEMVDGYKFNGAKAYKDSKMCMMMTANFLHQKYHRGTGITFCSIYPGCIAESPLFREKRAWFRKYFPVFMKYVTGGFVSEPEAGQRLFQAITDPRCVKSGVYWSWNGGPRENRGLESLDRGGQINGGGGSGGGWDSIYENDQSDKVLDQEKAMLMFKYSTDITGAAWPLAKQPVSPCPTLAVIKFVTNILDKQEAAKAKALGTAGSTIEQPEAKSMADILQRLSLA
eukprot:scaffold735_cov159-Ochromonas_danica.AAC.16